MKTKENNFAYIDGNNLYRGVLKSNWKIDFIRFRKWLSDKYSITRAYYFMGLIPEQRDLYAFLQKTGYVLIFREVSYNDLGEPKGNCDADLVLESVKDFYEKHYDRQILVTSDGDYASLVKFLKGKNSLKVILSPSIQKECSILLKRAGVPLFIYTTLKIR